MTDCKEGDLIDWGTKLQVGCLYTFGECTQTMPDTISMAGFCARMLSIPHIVVSRYMLKQRTVTI